MQSNLKQQNEDKSMENFWTNLETNRRQNKRHKLGLQIKFFETSRKSIIGVSVTIQW